MKKILLISLLFMSSVQATNDLEATNALWRPLIAMVVYNAKPLLTGVVVNLFLQTVQAPPVVLDKGDSSYRDENGNSASHQGYCTAGLEGCRRPSVSGGSPLEYIGKRNDEV